MWPFKKKNQVKKEEAPFVQVVIMEEVPLMFQEVTIRFKDGTTKVFVLEERQIYSEEHPYTTHLEIIRNGLVQAMQLKGIAKLENYASGLDVYLRFEDVVEISFTHPAQYDVGFTTWYGAEGLV